MGRQTKERSPSARSAAPDEQRLTAALARKESRFSHYRLDHQERDDVNWLRHTLVSYRQDVPVIDHKPANITMYEPKRREY